MTLPLSNSDSHQILKPFLKWAGGKRALLPELLSRVPENFDNYLEPFLGGGALFFELKRLGKLDNKKVYLFDKNKELINTYKIVQNQPKELLKLLKNYKEKHSHDFYYETRAMDREDNFADLNPVARAARFIYLNKTCFNGLYRVNSKGYHNVPLGSYKNPNIYDENIINLAHIALQGANIEVADFSKTLEYANLNDFVYFDPPYYPINATSSFTSYHQDIFLDDEQKRLFGVFRELDKKGVYVMESNSSAKFIDNLYEDYKIYCIVMVGRNINSKINNRGKIEEFLIRGKKWNQ